jgi:hypothetical protein
MVGQYLKTDVSPTGSIQLGSIGASQLSVGINPLIFRKYLAFHRLNPFVVDLLKKYQTYCCTNQASSYTL